MIKISDIEKCYHTDELDIVALNKMSIEVDDGEFVAIMGPSGCGKSTLLNILGFLDDPDRGSYVFNGVEVTHFNERKRANLRKQNVGFLFQNFNLIDDLTVFENVELPMIYTGLPTSVRAKKAEEILDRMHIGQRRKTYPQQLSGGEQQRVALARAVVNKPRLILADEPTANLDHDNGKKVMDLLNELNKEGVTIVMVTHSEDDAKYSHRVIRLGSARIKKQRFWYLLEKKLIGTCSGSEQAELDEMASTSEEVSDTIALVDRLWKFHSVDQIEQVIRQELADGHEKKYLWPEQCRKTANSSSACLLFLRIDEACSNYRNEKHLKDQA